MTRKKAGKTAKAAKKGGRPKLPNGKIRGGRLEIRLTAGELTRLESDAAAAGVTLSDHIRQRCGLEPSGYSPVR